MFYLVPKLPIVAKKYTYALDISAPAYKSAAALGET
jgi:hypothetical protein